MRPQPLTHADIADTADTTPFLADLLIIRNDSGSVWLIWRVTVDPLDRFETLELTGTRKETL